MPTRHLLPFAAALAAAGCSLFAPEASVRVIIPQPPAHWQEAFTDLWFVLAYMDGQGASASLRVEAGQTEASISCPKAGNSAVLAYPRTSQDGGALEDLAGPLRPAGGLYPSSLEVSRQDPTLLLSWEAGPVASVMWRLAAAGGDVSLVNATRLSIFIEKAADEEAADPWELDLDAIVQKLADGAFSAYDIEPLSSREVRVAPGPGSWFTESPFFSAREATGQSLDIPLMSYGLHYLFSREGGLAKLQVGNDGAFIVTLRSAARGAGGRRTGTCARPRGAGNRSPPMTAARPPPPVP